jgi:hypothetical protein
MTACPAPTRVPEQDRNALKHRDFISDIARERKPSTLTIRREFIRHFIQFRLKYK